MIVIVRDQILFGRDRDRDQKYQSRRPLASPDVVSHALSHSVLFNEFEFHFCSKILILQSFNPIQIATRFLSPT